MEKIAIYGLGGHFKEIVDKYMLPIENVVVFIDKYNQRVHSILGKKVITLDEFREIKNSLPVHKIVVSSNFFFDEIKSEIMELGICSEKNIIFIDEWVSENNIMLRQKDLYSNLILEEEKYLHERMNEIDEIDNQLLKNARVYSNRNDGIGFIPQNAIVAEVGVAYGDFTEQIINNSIINKFYAIDLFMMSDIWGRDTLKKANLSHYEFYANRFRKEIDDGMLFMKKGYSWDVLSLFPDNYFDWLYLDADHRYDAVVKDINIISKKVRNGGIIQFNDYTAQDSFGVIPAVNNFINNTGSEVLGICLANNGYHDLIVRNNRNN